MYYTVADIVKRFGVNEHAVLGWIKNRELRAINVGRSQGKKKPRWRISQAALEDFERSRTSAPLAQEHKVTRRRAPQVVDMFP
jgi:hypothetical protein